MSNYKVMSGTEVLVQIPRDAPRAAVLPPVPIYKNHLKRVLDIVLVLVAAAAVLPVVLVFALVVFLTDGHSPFYCQERIGKDRRVFRMWKLRSMVVDADQALQSYLAAHPEARAEWDRHQKLSRDPRITWIGGIIRKTSLDELPQLWNVLRGDMSLVGPRPIMTNQVDLYPGTAYYRLRPGLTGFWQVSSRNKSTFAERARFDRLYEDRVSFVTDAAVILRTVSVVLRGTGV
jgi:exopolysaccharide production protein ExoY